MFVMLKQCRTAHRTFQLGIIVFVITITANFHAEYQKTVEAAVTRTLLFGDRFPFRYLTDDYGLEYYAAFSGCCAQGLEFVLAGDYTYPEDYPELGTEITVTGTFQTYEEDGYLYCHLIDARMEGSRGFLIRSILCMVLFSG